MRRYLKAKMVERGVTATMLARVTGVTERIISNWIANSTEMGINDAIKIRNTYFDDIDLQTLFADDRQIIV